MKKTHFLEIRYLILVFLLQLKNFYELSWKLRLVGSALDSGDFSRAERMAYLEYR